MESLNETTSILIKNITDNFLVNLRQHLLSALVGCTGLLWLIVILRTDSLRKL